MYGMTETQQRAHQEIFEAYYRGRGDFGGDPTDLTRYFRAIEGKPLREQNEILSAMADRESRPTTGWNGVGGASMALAVVNRANAIERNGHGQELPTPRATADYIAGIRTHFHEARKRGDAPAAAPAAATRSIVLTPETDVTAMAVQEVLGSGHEQRSAQVIALYNGALEAVGANATPKDIATHLHRAFEAIPASNATERGHHVFAMAIARRIEWLQERQSKGENAEPLVHTTRTLRKYFDESIVWAASAGSPATAPAREAPANSEAPAAAVSGGGSETNAPTTRATQIDKQVQYDLEMLYPNIGTGRRNHANVAQGVEAMDGLNGAFTSRSIQQFCTDNGITDVDPRNPSAEVIRGIREAAAARGAAPEQPAQETAAPATPAATTDLRTQLAAELAPFAGVSDVVKNYSNPFLDDAGIRRMALSQLSGANLSQVQQDSITVQGGVISSPELRRVEAALGFQVDGKMDQQLENALKNSTIRNAIGTMLATAEPAAPAATPPTAGGTGRTGDETAMFY